MAASRVKPPAPGQHANSRSRQEQSDELMLQLLLDLAYEPPEHLVRQALELFPPDAASSGRREPRSNVA